MTNYTNKKRRLEKAGKQTNWAPFWAVIKKFGQGKKVHPSAITHVKRSWRNKKLRLRPRKLKKDYLG